MRVLGHDAFEITLAHGPKEITSASAISEAPSDAAANGYNGNELLVAVRAEYPPHIAKNGQPIVEWDMEPPTNTCLARRW